MAEASSLVMPVALLALVSSSLFVLGGWRRRREWLQRQGQPLTIDRFDLGQTPFSTGTLDVAAEAGWVLRQCENLAAVRFVMLELAVQPGLSIRSDRRAFREILGDLITNAIEESPCGRVLLGAARMGGRVQISVSDDGAVADVALRRSQLRSAESLAALQGVTMEIDTRQGRGTTVLLRLPASANGVRPVAVLDRLDPVKVLVRSPPQASSDATR